MSKNPAHKLKALEMYACILQDHHKTWHTEDISYVRYRLQRLINHINLSTTKTIISSIKCIAT
jgi:hypothetical protein